MNTKNIVVFGAGGLGREVIWYLEEINSRKDYYNILGFIDDSPELEGTSVNGYPVLGNTDWLVNYDKPISVAICIGNSVDRKMVYEKLSANPNIAYPCILAEGARWSDTVKFGKGCIICPSSIITVNIALGDFVVVNLDCTIGHDSRLDDFVTLYPSVNVSGNVRIGECTEVGVGSNIIQGKTIGNNTIIGAGAVVVRDICENCTAVGVPAVPIKFHKSI